MNQKLGRNTIVLLGVGHTNSHVLRMWKMGKRPHNSQLVCVSDFPIATYSGMLPGALAGQYPLEKMEIDLVRFSQSAGARLVIGKVTGLDRARQQLIFADRPPLTYDLLSVGIGSRPTLSGVNIASDSALLVVKPMQTFMRRLRDRVQTLTAQHTDRPLKICVVGGGIGSIEIAFGLRQRFRADGIKDPEISLVTSAPHAGKGLLDSTVQKIAKQFQRHSIDVKSGNRVAGVESDHLTLVGGGTIEADIVIWATNAVAHDLFKSFDLEKDDRGFILTGPTLQSVSDERIFAVGDSGTIADANLDKAGVYAVRQGPILTTNLERFVQSRTLEQYKPQKNYLKIVNVCDGTAISQHFGRSVHGRAQWWLKNRIDEKFMKMYQDYSLMQMKPEAEPLESEMRCLGCGGKVGGQILSGVMDELGIQDNANVVIGLNNPDDAAIVKTKGEQVTVTTDFFAAPLSDPYLVGRIAALNSLSDLFVMGAEATAGLTIVQLPEGHPKSQSRVMYELMCGAKHEMDLAGASIVGGHTIEGPRVVMGFTVLGNQLVDPSTKSNLRAGDRLILSKPLGSGVMLAALMQAKLRGEYFLPLLDTMLVSNKIALDLIVQHDVSAITDVTGFGFAGHLLEMLSASQLGANIDLDAIPVIEGATELVDAGIESTLAPENRWREAQVEIASDRSDDARYKLMFDPQTCGGLLLGVRPENETTILELLRSSGLVHATPVGTVIASPVPKIRIGFTR